MVLKRSMRVDLPILGIGMLALALRLYNLEFQSLWRDEVDVIRFSSADINMVLSGFFKQGENGPLYYLFHHYWLGIAGTSERALRLPSAVFGAASVLVVFQLGKLLLDRKTALMASLIAALSPFYVWHSQDGKMYALLLLLTCISLYSYLMALQTGRKSLWAVYLFVTSLSLYVHFFAALLLCAEAFLFLLFFRDRQRTPWFIAMSALTLPYLPLAMWQIPTLISPPSTGYPPRGPTDVITILLVSFVRGYGPANPFLTLSLGLFLLASGTVLYATRKRRRWTSVSIPSSGYQFPSSVGISILLVWLLVPVAVFGVLSLRMSLFTERYLIVVTPAFYLLIAAGLTAIGDQQRKSFCATVALWLAISLHSLVWQYQIPLKADFRAAASFLATTAKSNDLFIFNMPYIRHTFQYYYERPIRWLDASYTNNGHFLQQPSVVTEAQLDVDGNVWLVSSEEYLWDSTGITRLWLRDNLELDQITSYRGVQIERYIPLWKK